MGQATMTDRSIIRMSKEGASSSNDTSYAVLEIEGDEMEDSEIIEEIEDLNLGKESDVNSTGTGDAIRTMFEKFIVGTSGLQKAYYSPSSHGNTHSFWVIIDEEDINLRQQFYDIEYDMNEIFDGKRIETTVVSRESDPDLSQVPDDAVELNTSFAKIGQGHAQSV
jgi:hypothetical protein